MAFILCMCIPCDKAFNFQPYEIFNTGRRYFSDGCHREASLSSDNSYLNIHYVEVNL